MARTKQNSFIIKITSIIEFLKRKVSEKGSLKSRLLRGGIWLSAGTISEQGLRFVRNMILTRLLAPEAFGTMAIIIAVKMAMESITNIGINKAIIQNPRGAEQKYLNGAWWLALARVSGLYLFTFISAPWIAKFYNNQELVVLIRITFLSIIFEGALSSKAYIAVKEMNFLKWAIIFHGGGIIGIFVAIITAFVWQNIGAIVVGIVVEAVARWILSFIICPFLPRLHFEKESLHTLFKYTRGMFGLGFLYFIYMRVDHFVIGKLCSASELGLYSMAMALAQTPFQLMTALIGQMAMPAFAEMQDDHRRINDTIIKITTIIIYISFPLLFFITLQGASILKFIYGPVYTGVALPFAILFGSSALRFCSVPIAELYYALGRPELQRYFTGVRAILMVVLIIPAVKYWGVTGAALAGFFSMLVGTLIQIYKLHGLSGLDLGQYSFIFLKATLLSSWVVIIWLLTQSFFSSQTIVTLIPGLVGCIISYLFMTAFYLKTNSRTIPLFNSHTS